jgi:predicted RNase H-like HicB family nuclease
MKQKKRTIEEYMALDYPFIVVPFHEKGFSGYRAFLLDIPAVESIGATPEEALSDLNDVKKEWIAFAIEKSLVIPEPETDFPTTMKYSGRVTLRIPKTLHRQAAERALLDGVSLNMCLNEAIQRGMIPR